MVVGRTPAEALDAAFEATPRTGFLPPDQRRWAADDRALPIGHGQTNSQPSTVRAMLRLLDVRAGQRVLDVGAGSGWTTALLAQLVGPTGEVVGVEVVPELVELGRADLARQGLPQARIEPAVPGVLGLPDRGPYDRVLVSAAARRLPGALLAQLRPGGVLVAPVAGRMTVARRAPTAATGPGADPFADLEVVRGGSYAFVPLVGA